MESAAKLSTPTPDMRERVLLAAAALVAAGGPDAITTRAVATAAGTQGPTIYRLFHDKQGLLDAVAERALADYVASKQAGRMLDDPVDDLRAAWDMHVAFGLGHPTLYYLMSAAVRGGTPSPAMEAGIKILRQKVHRVALAGLLAVSEERAVALIHATGTGTITALLEQEASHRDPGLAAAARDMVMATIVSDQRRDGDDTHRLAVTLRARLEKQPFLSPGERLLMSELLGRLEEA